MILKKFIKKYLRYLPFLSEWDAVGLKKYTKNTGWAFFGKAATFIISFFTAAIVVRYLGPEQYGQLSYAQNFVAIISVFAVLGFDQVIYRELIARPEKRNVLLGTSIAAKTFFGLLSLVAAVTASWFTQSDPTLTWLIFIVALTFIFQPVGTIGHFFNAQVKTKYITYITLLVAVVLPLSKLLFVYLSLDIYAFALLLVAESVLFGLGYLWIYVRVFRLSPRDWRVSMDMFWQLLRQSWPLALASLSGYIYGRIDQVMILSLINSESVGWYDIAVRMSELLTFVPAIIVASLFPAIINSRKSSLVEYKKRLRALAFIGVVTTSLSAVVLFLIAPRIIQFLFGQEFLPSIPILRVYLWSSIGTILIILIQNYLIAEKRQIDFLLYSLLGAAVNVTLNLVLVPSRGVLGAAYATVMTFVVIVVVFSVHERWFSRTNV